MIIIDALYDNTYDLTHTVIGHNNIITTDNITGTAGADNTLITALANPLTYDRYKPSATAIEINIDAGVKTAINYIGIEGIGLLNSSVVLYGSDDDITYYQSATLITIDNEGAFMWLLGDLEYRYYRISFLYIPTTATLGAVYIGEVLQMMRPLYGGHKPGTMSRRTDTSPNTSETGQFLGKSIKRSGYTEQFEFKNLTASWIRSDFDQFIVNARTKPFFIAWRPETFVDEVLYGWTNEDIQPVNMGVRDLMQVSFNVIGYDG